MATLSNKQAYELAKKLGFQFKHCFETETNEQKSKQLTSIAGLRGYTKRTKRRISKAHAFYDHLKSLKKANKWR